jgi:hypothetical protein
VARPVDLLGVCEKKKRNLDGKEAARPAVADNTMANCQRDGEWGKMWTRGLTGGDVVWSLSVRPGKEKVRLEFR